MFNYQNSESAWQEWKCASSSFSLTRKSLNIRMGRAQQKLAVCMTSYSSPGWRRHPEALHTDLSLSGGGKRPEEETEAGGSGVVWRGGLEGELTRLHWYSPTAPATAAARRRRRGRHCAPSTCATKRTKWCCARFRLPTPRRTDILAVLPAAPSPPARGCWRKAAASDAGGYRRKAATSHARETARCSRSVTLLDCTSRDQDFAPAAL